MGKTGFTRAELALVGTAALLVFSRVFGVSVVLPNFRGHYSELLQVDSVWIGVAFSAYALTMALMQFPNGVLSDRFGRKPLLLASSALFVGGSVLAAFAESLPLLIAARLIQGLGAVASIAMAGVGETIPAERRTMAMAMVGIPAGLGFLVGIAAGPALYPAIGMVGLFLLTAAVGFLPALALLRVSFAAPMNAPPALTKPLAPPVLALALAGFCSNYILTTTLFFLPNTDWRTLVPMLAVAFLGIGVLSRRIDRAGLTWQPIAIALACLGAAAAVYAQVPGAGFWIGGALFFTFHSLLATTLPSNVSRIAGPSGGRGHGLQNVIAYVGTFVAGPIAGALANKPSSAFALGLVLAVGAALMVAVVFMRMPQDSNGAPTEADPTP